MEDYEVEGAHGEEERGALLLEPVLVLLVLFVVDSGDTYEDQEYQEVYDRQVQLVLTEVTAAVLDLQLDDHRNILELLVSFGFELENLHEVGKVILLGVFLKVEFQILLIVIVLSIKNFLPFLLSEFLELRFLWLFVEGVLVVLYFVIEVHWVCLMYFIITFFLF